MFLNYPNNPTAAIATVSAAEFDRVPVATFERALMGKVAGADIQANNGAPGGGMQIWEMDIQGSGLWAIAIQSAPRPERAQLEGALGAIRSTFA